MGTVPTLSAAAAPCLRALSPYDVRRHFDRVIAFEASGARDFVETLRPEARRALDAELERRVAVARAARVAEAEAAAAAVADPVYGLHRHAGRSDAERRKNEARNRARNRRRAAEGCARDAAPVPRGVAACAEIAPQHVELWW